MDGMFAFKCPCLSTKMPKQRRLEGPQHGQTRHDPRQQQHRLDVISPSNPLAISELIEMVGHCLDRHSLTMCLRVSRQWYQVLLCQVWEVIEKYMGGCSPPEPKKSNGPSLPFLSKHADLVRKLFLKIHTGDVGFPGRRPIYCLWLTELKVATLGLYTLDHINSFFEENLAPFIVEHRATLKKLVLPINQSKALTGAMISCSNLESLMTRAPFLGEGKELDGWKYWYESQGSRLQKLNLIDATSSLVDIDLIMDEAMDALLSETSASSLRNLELMARGATLASQQGQMLLVMKSPGLKRLSWSILNSKGAITRLAEAFEKSSHGLFCQQLESLSFPNHGDVVLADFKRVVDSLPALTDLELAGYDKISRDIPSYLTTLSRLRRLNIDGCGWAPPSVVQDILCSMPNLEVFVADTLSDKAIEKDPRTWVCTCLKELSVSLLVFSGPISVKATAEGRMLDRLCQLERLERLKFLHVTSHGGREAGPFRFEMESRLDKLKTLRGLRSFEAPVGQWWTEAEARWVLKNWTQLRELDIHMDSKAKELLSHRLMKKPMGEDTFRFRY